MGLFVNSNVASLNAQRSLNGATRSLTKSFQRLSSGMRINSAKDDAAGLGISDRMTSQVRGINGQSEIRMTVSRSRKLPKVVWRKHCDSAACP